MATTKQAAKRRLYKRKVSLKYSNPTQSRTPILKKCPQAKGIVTRVVTVTPKKPNSALRHIAKIDLNNGLRLRARLPGISYLCSKYNRILVRGGRANDLPGIGYSAIRGVYDFSSVVGKIRRRSIYGVSRPAGYSNYIRKSLRE